MAFVMFAGLVAGVTGLALAWRQRWAPWMLLSGLVALAGFWLMRGLHIPWPELGQWTVFPLNPYLLITLAYALVLAGLIGITARFLRCRFGWFSA